jgi:hypothetical protein
VGQARARLSYICRENPEIFNVKGCSLKDFQPPVVLIKQKAHFQPISQKAHHKGKSIF